MFQFFSGRGPVPMVALLLCEDLKYLAGRFELAGVSSMKVCPFVSFG